MGKGAQKYPGGMWDFSSTREIWTRNKNLGYINLLVIFEFMGLDEFVYRRGACKEVRD